MKKVDKKQYTYFIYKKVAKNHPTKILQREKLKIFSLFSVSNDIIISETKRKEKNERENISGYTYNANYIGK